MSSPVSFLDALKARYGVDDVDEYDASAFLVGDATRRRNKTWELVGMEKTRQKQARFDRLVDVVLRSSGITVAVKESEKKSAEEGGAATDALTEAGMVRLRTLDLSDNTDLPLGELTTLIAHFPALTGLQVSDVPRLLPPLATGPPSSSSVSAARLVSPALTTLIFNHVGFQSVFQLRSLVELPNLSELHLDSNDLTNFSLFASEAEAQAYLETTAPAPLPQPPTNGDACDDITHLFAPLRFGKVTTLSLAHNKIASWGAEDDDASPAAAHTRDTSVRRGVRCGLGYTLTAAFPAVTRLFLTNNALPNITLPSTVIQADVAARVAALTCGADGSDSVTAPSTSCLAMVPPYLHFLRRLVWLCLNDNDTLTSPRIVDVVRVACPSLETFRITYGNLLPQWNETLSRMYVVASLPTIQLLNRSQVRPKERLDSELFYVQRGLAARESEERESGGDAVPADLPDTHAPTYALLDYLSEKHKDIVLSIYKEGSTAGSDGSAHRMLDVTLFFENGYKASTTATTSSSSSSSPSLVKRQLPSSLTIGKLKALVKVVFQVDPVNQVLGYRSGDDGVLQVPVELTNEMQTLAYYGVPNGSTIVVRDSSLR